MTFSCCRYTGKVTKDSLWRPEKKQSLTGNIRHCQIRESGWEVGKKKKKKKRNCTELSPLSFTLNGLESGESLRPWSLRVTINRNFSGRCCCSALTLRTAPSLYCLFPWYVFAHSQLNHVRLHFSKTNTKKESMLNFANSCTGKTVIEREWLNEWNNTAQ